MKPKEESFEQDEMPIALVLNVDLYSTIRLYQVHADLTELIFQVNITDLLRFQKINDEEDPDEATPVQVQSVEFQIKTKMLIVTTVDNRIFLLSP